MIYLICAIFANAIIGIIFKTFQRFGIDTFQAIVVNYIVCVLVGTLSFDVNLGQHSMTEAAWLPFAAIAGGLFIVGFNLLAKTIQTVGVGPGTVVQKMSIALSAVFAIVYFHEPLVVTRITGILLSIPVILLATGLIPYQADQPHHFPPAVWVLLILTWLTSGLIDSLLMFVERVLLDQSGDPTFVVTLFFFAGVFGGLKLLFDLATKRTVFRYSNVLAGIALGIPNFFSIYWLMKAYGYPNLEPSQAITIVQIGTILMAGLLAALFLHERLTKYQWVGLGFAVIAIILIAI